MKRNIFRVDENITSYKYPILKILSCIIVITALLLLKLNKDLMNLITIKFIDYVRALGAAIFIVSIFCIITSFAELILAYENRTKRKLLKINIFRVDQNITSYGYPIVKIILFVLLIILGVNRNHIIPINDSSLNAVIGYIGAAFVVICIFCIYISFAELIFANENRAKGKSLTDKAIRNSKEYDINEIISLAENNDIIEIEIMSGKKPLEIGTSSYSESAYSELTDKRYYIGKKEFSNIEDFRSALSPYLINNRLMVISIDGIAAKKFKN